MAKKPRAKPKPESKSMWGTTIDKMLVVALFILVLSVIVFLTAGCTKQQVDKFKDNTIGRLKR